ncbi:MAG: 2Fe-2S iron-sulfur cluster-binding protein [Sphingomonas sp.]
MAASPIRFVLDGRVDVQDDASNPQETVLDRLRGPYGRTGTKEGCAEGDCGACTVLLGELDGDGVKWRAVNSCILFVPMLDGKAVLTVESLARDGVLHPVQRAMADGHGSQCGFCTPGFVMSLVGRSMGASGTEGVAVKDVIAGNLCRCTGYGPILEAGEANPPAPRDDARTAELLRSIQPTATQGRNWFKPRTSDALAALLVGHPDARIVAGATM